MTRQRKQVTPASTLSTILSRTAAAAFVSLEEEIRAVPAEALVPINLDVSRAARRGLAVAERVQPLLEAMAKLTDLDFRAVEDLERRALAVLHADELFAQSHGGRGTLMSTLMAEAGPLRELMLGGLELLTLVGLAPADRVAAIRSGQGHADTADDLQAMGRLYREIWAQVHDKVPVTTAMVERATILSVEINRALGVREIDADPLVEPADPRRVRAQAFTLFAQAYDECRRGVTYLRWHHGDARAIVPSVYPPPTRRSADEAAAVEDLREASALGEPPGPEGAPSSDGAREMSEELRTGPTEETTVDERAAQ